jgi:hypothetical protein
MVRQGQRRFGLELIKEMLDGGEPASVNRTNKDVRHVLDHIEGSPIE